MTVIIQAFVIVIAIIILSTALSKHSSHAGHASKKIGLTLLALAMVVAVLFPDTTNVIAHAVGVGRGADLLLYMTVVAFILYALNNYLHMQNQREMLHKLARHVAILEAKSKNKLPK